MRFVTVDVYSSWHIFTLFLIVNLKRRIIHLSQPPNMKTSVKGVEASMINSSDCVKLLLWIVRTATAGGKIWDWTYPTNKYDKL